jgi:PTS system galactitol-specific IIA component
MSLYKPQLNKGCALKVILYPDVSDRSEIITLLGENLHAMGVVKIGYAQEVIAREEEYPTGLQLTGQYNIALPHGGPDLVNENAIIVGVLKDSLEFFMMGEPQKSIPVHIVFMFAAVDYNSINKYVQNLVDGVLLKPEIVREIIELSDEEMILSKLEDSILSDS